MLKNEIAEGLKLMTQLRDEIRLKIHLASMDTKTEWNKLEPEIVRVEQAAHQVNEATRAALSKTVKRLNELRSSLI